MGFLGRSGQALARRAEQIRGDAREQSQHALSSLVGREGGLFGAKREVSEFVISEARTSAMSDLLRGHAAKLAASRIREMRDTGIERELPTLHKAQKVTFDEGRMQVHMGSRASFGANVVALPNFRLSEGCGVEQRRGVQLFEFESKSEGGMTLKTPASGLMENADGLSIDFVFSDQRENLRERPRTPER